MESHEAGFPPLPQSLEIPSGFPHSQGLDDWIYLFSCPLYSIHRHRKGLVTDVSGPKCNERSGTLSAPSMSFVNGWAQGNPSLHRWQVFASEFLWCGEPGNNQRQSLKLPYAGWLPHERVSSQVCLGLRTGVGRFSGPRGLTRITMTGCPAPYTIG